MIETRTVKNRRPLRFNSVQELLAEVDLLAASDRAGQLRRSGNWTLGQALGHLGAWVDFAFDGYPVKPPWVVRALIRPMKARFLNRPLPEGVRLPGVKGGTVATEPLSTDEGLRRFRSAWERLVANAPSRPNPVFGPLAHDEWIKAHLRHAELHLGFFRAPADGEGEPRSMVS
ncbi:MAG: DUF1569 domain-containing protein [Phycisphaerales bacterium]